MRCPGEEILRAFSRATIEGPRGPVATHITTCPNCLQRVARLPDASSAVKAEVKLAVARLPLGTMPPPVTATTPASVASAAVVTTRVPTGTTPPVGATADAEPAKAAPDTSAEKSAQKSTAKSAAKPAQEAAEKAAETAAEKPAGKPGDPTTEKVTPAKNAGLPSAPKRRMWPWVIATGATAALVGVAIMVELRRNRAGGGSSCAGSERQLTGVWDPAVRADIERAFTTAARPHGAHALEAINARIDDYTAQWSAKRGEKCDAPRVACFDDKLVRLRAVTDVLRTADAATVDHAIMLASALPPLASCDAATTAPATPANVTVETALVRAAIAASTPDRDRAATLYREALTSARAANDERATAAALIGIAHTTGADGELAQAEPLVTKLDNGGPLDADLREARGALLVAKGEHERALVALERALAIREQVYGKQSVQLSSVLAALARSERASGQRGVARALEHEQRRVAILEPALGPDHPELGQALAAAAQTLEALGRDDEARGVARRALEVTERAYGKRHAEVGASLLALAHVEQLTGNYDEAKQLLARARSVFERDVKMLAHVLGVQAQLHFDEGDYRAAADVQGRAFALVERALPAEDLQRAHALHVTGTIKLMLGDDAAARTDLEAALAMRERLAAPPVDVASSLTWLAMLERDAGRVARARELARRAVRSHAEAIRAAALGPHPRASTMATAFELITTLTADAATLDDARDNLALALDLVEKEVGTRAHPRAGTLLVALAEVSVKKGDRAGAEPLFEQALTALAKDPPAGARGQRRADAAMGLAALLWAQPEQRGRARDLVDAAAKAYQAGGVRSAERLAAAQRWLREHTVD